MAPGRVLPRHPDDQRLDRSAGGRPSWPAPAGVVPLTGDEATVPAQNRGRGDREDLRPPTAAHQPGQRRKPEPVGVIPPQAAAELAAQHLVLVAQHEQLDVLGQVRPDQHRQQAEQAPHQAVGERQQHAAMLSARPLPSQQNPSSRHKTEFPSGTPTGQPGSVWRGDGAKDGRVRRTDIKPGVPEADTPSSRSPRCHDPTLRRAYSRNMPPARPVRGRPWNSRRCAPTVMGHESRPLCVRGHRDTPPRSATR